MRLIHASGNRSPVHVQVGTWLLKIAPCLSISPAATAAFTENKTVGRDSFLAWLFDLLISTESLQRTRRTRLVCGQTPQGADRLLSFCFESCEAMEKARVITTVTTWTPSPPKSFTACQSQATGEHSESDLPCSCLLSPAVPLTITKFGDVERLFSSC